MEMGPRESWRGHVGSEKAEGLSVRCLSEVKGAWGRGVSEGRSPVKGKGPSEGGQRRGGGSEREEA